MTIADMIKEKGNVVFTIKTSSTAFDAVAALDKNRVGALLVMDDDDKVAGIISERDILYKCYNSDTKLEEQTVENLMTGVEDIIIGKMSDTPRYLMDVMTNKRIRHIPILENEAIVGIISIGDLIKTVLENSEIESRRLREYIANPFGVHIYKQD